MQAPQSMDANLPTIPVIGWIAHPVAFKPNAVEPDLSDSGDGNYVFTAGYTMQKSGLPNPLSGADSAALSQSAGNGSESPRLAAGWMAIEAHLPRMRSLVHLREKRCAMGALYPSPGRRDPG